MARIGRRKFEGGHHLLLAQAFLSLLFSFLALFSSSLPASAEVPTPSTVEAATGKTASSNPQPVQDSSEDFRPRLSIPIPNLSLSAIKVQKGTDSGPGYVDIPWIAQYITGVYTYSTYIAGVIATVMFMIGGFQYLTAGGDKGRVDAGKKRISDSVIGMLMVLGAYTMLKTVNPTLTTVTPLRIPVVAKKTFEIISPQNMVAATGKPALKAGPMVKLIREKALAAGGPKFDCFVYASLVHESGGRQDALGHDENAATTVFSVGARQSFINSGKMASGETFTPVGCSDRSCQNKGPAKNDDSLDISKPPDYGLDWRYSHGIGAGQSTIFPGSKPCPGKENEGRGFRMGSKCASVPELLNADTQADMMVAHYQYCWNVGQKGDDVAAGYVCYAGKIEKDNPIIVSRINVYNTCVSGIGQ